ncbi:MerR family transcriptional regulator [candidate division KSB1 bacterium]
MNQKLYSVEKASELSGLGIDTIRKFIELKAVASVKNDRNNILISSFGIDRLKKISELLDRDFSKAEIVKELDIK